MANKISFPGAGDAKEQALAAARDRADNTRPRGKLPHEIAEKANMKRQQKKMHRQDNK